MCRILIFLFPLLLASCGSIDSASKHKGKALDFEWDFSEQRKIKYSFTQTTNVLNKMDRDSSVDKSFFTGTGDLTIRVKENDRADFSITDLEIKSVDRHADDESADTTTQTLPNIVVQDMHPDGKFEDPNVDMMLDLLFALPNERLKVGDSCKIPMRFPFNANGSRLNVKGYNTLTFIGYEEMDGVDCAVLKGVINVSQLEIPEELDGEYASSAIGKATYYLDVDRRIFIRADVQLTMEVFIDSPSEEFIRDLFMDMKSKNDYQIRFKQIEE